ncbi:MAG: hypothetical protein ACKOYC_03570 [Bacteroidota bacterium]
MSSEKGYKKTVHNFYERQHRKKSASYFIYLTCLIASFVWLGITLLEHDPFVLLTFGYWIPLVGLVALSLLFVFRFHFAGLITAINEQGIFIKRTPFQKNFTMMLWEDIREVRLTADKGFSSARHYSRFFRTGTPFGIEIVSRSGRKKFISSNKIESLPRILSRLAEGKFRSTGIGENIDYRE